MAEEKRTTQKGNMTINLFLWILSSSKTTRIPRFYRSAVLQVHLQMLTERRTPFPPPGPKVGTPESVFRAQSQPPSTSTGSAPAQELRVSTARTRFDHLRCHCCALPSFTDMQNFKAEGNAPPSLSC